MDVLAPAASPSGPVGVSFVGRKRDLFGILLRGNLLQIPTFGFYRFWLITNIRRHIWSQTTIGPDALEYTGRGRELLIGFLIAMAILIPIYVVYFLIGIELERQQAFASVPLFAALYVFGYYARYRARRYRATRTIFRGVRFWMTGSAWAYLGLGFLWDLVTLVTLGFAYPWRVAALERYKMRHTRYGSIEGSFVGTGWPLFKRVAWLWTLLLVGIGFTTYSVLAGMIVPVEFLIIVTALIAVLFLPFLRGAELRWWLDGVRLGPVVTTSELRAGTVVWCYVKTAFVFAAYLAVLGAIAMALVSVATWIMQGNYPALNVQTSVGFRVTAIAVVVLFYLLLLLGFDAIRKLILDRGVWAAAAGSVMLHNYDAVESVAGTGASVSSGVGEGILDALDLGGGF
jgi:uncharacterized membrane protein YjgN (DUF898 family)